MTQYRLYILTFFYIVYILSLIVTDRSTGRSLTSKNFSSNAESKVRL